MTRAKLNKYSAFKYQEKKKEEKKKKIGKQA